MSKKLYYFGSDMDFVNVSINTPPKSKDSTPKDLSAHTISRVEENGTLPGELLSVIDIRTKSLLARIHIF